MPNEVTTTPEELKKLTDEAYEKGKKEILDSQKNYGMPVSIENKKDEGIAAVRAIKSILLAHDRKISLQKAGEILVNEEKTGLNDRVAKALQLSDFTSGGALVPGEFSNEVIPYMYNNSVFLSKIPSKPMPQGSLTIPKETAGATIYWSGELSTNLVESTPQYGNIQLNSKNVAAMVVITNDEIRATNSLNLNLEQQIINALTKNLAQSIELQILEGTGASNTPLGVYARMTSTQRANSTGTTLDYISTDVAAAIQRIEANNIMIENGQWVMSSRSKNALLHMRNAFGILEWAQEVSQGKWFGMNLGYSNYISNTYSSTYSRVYLLDLAKMVLGKSKDLTFEVFPYGNYVDSTGAVQSGIQKDITVIKASMSLDFGMYMTNAAACIEQVSWV